MDNPEMIELTGSEFRFLIEKAHHSGLTYGRILSIMAEVLAELVSRAETEFWLMQNTPS